MVNGIKNININHSQIDCQHLSKMLGQQENTTEKKAGTAKGNENLDIGSTFGKMEEALGGMEGNKSFSFAFAMAVSGQATAKAGTGQTNAEETTEKAGTEKTEKGQKGHKAQKKHKLGKKNDVEKADKKGDKGTPQTPDKAQNANNPLAGIADPNKFMQAIGKFLDALVKIVDPSGQLQQNDPMMNQQKPALQGI